MWRRVAGACVLVLLVWGAAVVIDGRIESCRVSIEHQVERIDELESSVDRLRGEARALGAPDGMLPPVAVRNRQSTHLR